MCSGGEGWLALWGRLPVSGRGKIKEGTKKERTKKAWFLGEGEEQCSPRAGASGWTFLAPEFHSEPVQKFS